MNTTTATSSTVASTRTSIFSRPLDLVCFIYLIAHIPPVIALDTYITFPNLLPTSLHNFNQWFLEKLNDPLHREAPKWFMSFLYVEIFVQLPFFVYASIGLWKDNPRVRLPLLVYSVYAMTTMMACLTELFFGKHEELTDSQRYTLVSLYGPYFFLPALFALDSYRRLRETESAALQKKKAE